MIDAQKFRRYANTLQVQIDRKMQSGVGQAITARRLRMAEGAVEQLKKIQCVLWALAEMQEKGDIPDCLGILDSKAMVEDVVTYQRRPVRVLEWNRPERPEERRWSKFSNEEFVEAQDRIQSMMVLQDVDRTDLAEKKFQLLGIPGYFPTPPVIIQMMLDMVSDNFGEVLEPSAGHGAILDAIKSRTGISGDAVEINFSLSEHLRKKGYNVIGSDFLEMIPESKYNTILMNPPFEHGADIDHVTHAFKFLKPDGILISVMSPGFKFRGQKKFVDFREWLSDHRGEVLDTLDCSFKISGTGAKTLIVKLHHFSREP